MNNEWISLQKQIEALQRENEKLKAELGQSTALHDDVKKLRADIEAMKRLIEHIYREIKMKMII